MSQRPGKYGHNISRPLLIISIGLVSILLVVGIWGMLHGTFSGKPVGKSSRPSPGSTATSSNVPVSPLLFGTNMGLFNSNDQVLRSATTRNLLQQMHIRIIRMPARSSLSEATIVQAAQTIKDLGAIPLVILREAKDSNALAGDARIVADMNRLFVGSAVYYEYGNESDMQGIDAAHYTASWNTVIPQLKRIAPQAQFVGPVTFHYDRAYLTSFLRGANPRPDEVSWHEYTCDDSWASDICISHIDHWTNHISNARAAMTTTIGSMLPIMITEWNYAPNAVPNDGKNNNRGFMSTWTTRALDTLAANRIFASMQYSCTDTAIPLIASDDTITTQGMAFQSMYEQMITRGQQPTPAPTLAQGQPQPTATTGSIPDATPTVLLKQYQSFSFEDGSTDGWGAHGSEISGIQNSTTFALDGRHALEVTFTNIASDDFPYISVDSSNLSSPPHAGQTITAYIYLPNNSASFTAKVIVMDNNYHWLYDVMIRLTPSEWNRLAYTLPSIMNGQSRQLGIQFSTLADTPVSGDVYIDAVGWN